MFETGKLRLISNERVWLPRLLVPYYSLLQVDEKKAFNKKKKETNSMDKRMGLSGIRKNPNRNKFNRLNRCRCVLHVLGTRCTLLNLALLSEDEYAYIVSY